MSTLGVFTCQTNGIKKKYASMLQWRKFSLGLFSHAKAQVLQIHLIIAVIKVITLPVYSRAQGLLMGTNQDIKICCQLGLKAWGDNKGGLE